MDINNLIKSEDVTDVYDNISDVSDDNNKTDVYENISNVSDNDNKSDVDVNKIDKNDIISVINNTNIYSIDQTDYSQILFTIETSKCSKCNIDGYTLILNDYNLFKLFLNFKSIYLLKIFNIFKNILKI